MANELDLSGTFFYSDSEGAREALQVLNRLVTVGTKTYANLHRRHRHMACPVGAGRS